MAQARKRRRNTGSAKDTVIAILVGIIAVETYFLVRVYGPQRPVRRGAPARVSAPARPSLGKIAVIIDDNGYSRTDCAQINSLGHPVTISVLPQLPYSQQIAACAERDHQEVMLHLPMEPHQNHDAYPDDYIIKTTTPPRQVVAKLQQALAEVPQAVGVNNHMGSKATEDPQLMGVLFAQLKKDKLFFVDSRVTAKTICRPLAERYQLPFAQREIFLDNENNRPYIEGQFRQLAEAARKKGAAIGIGHARALTWEITREQLDLLAAQGFEIVTVKDIVADR